MNTLKYKGYIGSVGYSEPDKVFFGKIEGIDGLVNYEGESVKELTDAFPGTFNVRIAPDTHRDIANLAAEAGISINAFVKRALNDAVKHPWVEPSSLVQGYGAESPEPAMLMESRAPYGTRETLQLSVPPKDIALVKELAGRMGWEVIS